MGEFGFWLFLIVMVLSYRTGHWIETSKKDCVIKEGVVEQEDHEYLMDFEEEMYGSTKRGED